MRLAVAPVRKCMHRRPASLTRNLNETLSKVFKAIEASSIGTDSEVDRGDSSDDLDVTVASSGQLLPKGNEKLGEAARRDADPNLGTF